jgi:dipeptidyl aminopeptidase/acylaminoacyl peptidase
MPSGDELIYSMEGSLWRQKIGTNDAERNHACRGGLRLSAGRRADGGASSSRATTEGFELWRHDLESGAEHADTATGGVNLEPRSHAGWPQMSWSSTRQARHFNLKIADITPQGFSNERYLVAPRESKIDRYYYSTHDHAINPSWSPDGKRVYYVTNAEIPWGTGWICSVSVEDGKSGCLDRHRLESSWAARPEVAPDGKRILFSSYHGGQWHQLWLTTTDDAAPLALTYGGFDRRNARWSPDGKHIAYISNEHGNTELYVQDVFGGTRTAIASQAPKRLRPMAIVTLAIADGSGRPASARVSILGSDARWHAPKMRGCTATSSTTARNSRVRFITSTASRSCQVELPAGKTRSTW